MSRRVKQREARKEEFLRVASKLFESRGFESTSVDDIVEKMGVAKGLFYYYFESKDNLLELLIEELQLEIEESLRKVVQKEGLSALEKLQAMLYVSAGVKMRSSSLISYFHKPQNRYIHLDLERRGIEYFAPVLEEVIEQGVRDGIFHTTCPRETALAYLAVAGALGHRGPERMSKKEMLRSIEAFQEITENMLGAEPGTFGFYRNYVTGQLPKDVVVHDHMKRGRK